MIGYQTVKSGNDSDTLKVKIVLSRTHPDFIRKLFAVEVPEVAEEITEIRALAREAGYRTKVAVASLDEKQMDTIAIVPHSAG